jgi:DNA-binding transcriptional LysR family regulator
MALDTLLSMRVFVRVVETESFAATARWLKLSPAMVTKHVQHLEQRLGTRLLNRTTRQFSLTEAGAAYHERCVGVLSALEEAEAAVNGFDQLPRGRLRLTAPDNFGPAVLWPVLRDFAQDYPGIAIDLVLTDRVVDLVEEEVDLAIRMLVRPADSSLVARKLAVSTLITCAAPEYLARAGTPRKPGDLTGHKCLVYGEGAAHEGWEFACRGKRQRIKVARSLQCNQIRMLREAALGGGGIVMQPSFNVWSDLAAGRLVPVLDDWTAGALNIFLVYSSRRFLPAKTRLFIDYLTARFPGGPDHDPWLARAVPRRPGPGARGSAVRPKGGAACLLP